MDATIPAIHLHGRPHPRRWFRQQKRLRLRATPLSLLTDADWSMTNTFYGPPEKAAEALRPQQPARKGR